MLEILCSADAPAPEEYDRPSLEARLPVVLQESQQAALFRLIVHSAEVEWRWITGRDLLDPLGQPGGIAISETLWSCACG